MVTYFKCYIGYLFHVLYWSLISGVIVVTYFRCYSGYLFQVLYW